MEEIVQLTVFDEVGMYLQDIIYAHFWAKLLRSVFPSWRLFKWSHSSFMTEFQTYSSFWRSKLKAASDSKQIQMIWKCFMKESKHNWLLLLHSSNNVMYIHEREGIREKGVFAYVIVWIRCAQKALSSKWFFSPLHCFVKIFVEIVERMQ